MNLLYQGLINKNHMIINWNLLKRCNYTCRYCYHINNTNFSEFTLDTAICTIDKLNTLKNTSMDLHLSGGEPTLLKILPEIVEYAQITLKNKLKQVVLFTNGTAPISIYKSIMEKVSCNKLLYLSNHVIFNDDDILLHKIRNLLEFVSVDLAIMCDPCINYRYSLCYWKSVYDIIKNPSFNIHPILIREIDNFSDIDYNYTKDDISYINDLNMQLIKTPLYIKDDFIYKYESKNVYISNTQNQLTEFNIHSELNFRGMHCALGTNLLKIGNDGYITGSNCRNGVYSNVPIYDASFNFNDIFKVVTCDCSICSLKHNIKIPKFKKKLDAISYLTKFKM